MTSSREGEFAFTVLVNSCDAFSDCWAPFFTLFRRYWPDCDVPVLLNTELSDWTFNGLAVACTRVQEGVMRRLTWSECLDRALDQVGTTLVLYMQEDYFLERAVLDREVRRAAELMLRDRSIHHIALSRHGPQGAHQPHSVGFLEIAPRARYRVSTQAGLWRVETLRSYLRPDENGWMFEILGSCRAWRRRELFLAVDAKRSESAPFEYRHTGIIKGKWHPDIPRVFAAHGMSLDYERRGVYVEKSPVRRRVETLRQILANPGAVLRGLLT